MELRVSPHFILKDKRDKMSVYVVEKPSDNMMYSPVPTISRIRKKLQDFSDKDYLLLIGDPVAIGVCMHYALLNNRSKVKLLKWDNRDYKYNIIEVNINV